MKFFGLVFGGDGASIYLGFKAISVCCTLRDRLYNSL